MVIAKIMIVIGIVFLFSTPILFALLESRTTLREKIENGSFLWEKRAGTLDVDELKVVIKSIKASRKLAKRKVKIKIKNTKIKSKQEIINKFDENYQWINRSDVDNITTIDAANGIKLASRGYADFIDHTKEKRNKK